MKDEEGFNPVHPSCFILSFILHPFFPAFISSFILPFILHPSSFILFFAARGLLPTTVE